MFMCVNMDGWNLSFTVVLNYMWIVDKVLSRAKDIDIVGALTSSNPLKLAHHEIHNKS